MPGAIIALDQDRPGPTVSAGSPGISRNDLWANNTMHPRCTTSGNASFAWTLLDKPRGSTAALTNDTLIACAVTPDLAGSYRLQLATNGGGPGNIQVMTFRVRFDAVGNPTRRGWALPALGESPGESNYPVPGGNNARGYDEPLKVIMEDLLPFAEALPLPVEITFSAGMLTTDATAKRAGCRMVDLSMFPASISGKNREVVFAVTLDASDPAAVAQAYLFDEDDATPVALTTLDNSGAVNTTVPEEFKSSLLTVGGTPGDLRDDVEHRYSVLFQRLAGALIDTVDCYNARLIISYI